MWYFVLGLVLVIYVLINIILTNIFISIIETFVIFFRTKGDSNEDTDYFPVYEDYNLCKAVFHLPKIVWIQISVREFFNILSKPFKISFAVILFG